ncbi:MAG TPA: gliding motility-associated C-terminal domain-containing protein, partial [Bacteroidia bacterium]|nr:gliding motility-associated C-terminal domain-containing protein [Bacteroidia bacterium]
SNGCVTKATAAVFVDVVPVNACCDTSIAMGGTAVISATGGVGYVWTPTSNLGCYTCASTTATPTVTTTYMVTGTDANGCKGSAYVTITIECADFIVPNVFTPNGDNDNDFFLIKAYSMTTYNIEIYDRWGILMYKSSDVNSPWGGKAMSGQPAPDGVYYYIIKAKCGSTDYDRHGFVQIIRK